MLFLENLFKHLIFLCENINNLLGFLKTLLVFLQNKNKKQLIILCQVESY